MAQGKGRKRSDSHTFLFINRDASTINRSGKDLELDRVIQSHVQRGVRRKLRLGQQEAGRKSGSASPNKGSSQYAASENPRLDREIILPPQDAAYWESTIDSSFLDFIPDTDVGDPPLSEFVGSNVTPSPPSQNFTSNSPSPPHNSALSEANYVATPSTSHDLLTQHGPAFLHYWTNALLPEMFPFDTRCTKLGQSRHAPAIHAELQEATSEPAHLYSLAGAIAVQMLARNGTLNVPNMNSFEEIEMVVHFRTQAQASVQAALQSGTLDPSTCRSLQRLTSIAFLTDMPHAAASTFDTMMSAISAVGGLPSFSSYFIESEIVIHWHASLRTLAKPAINLWSVVAEPSEVARFRARSQSQTRHQSSVGSDLHLLAPPLRALLAETALTLRFASYAQTQPYDAEHAKWLSLTHLGVGYRLLELQVEGFIEEVVRIAAVYFVALTRAEMDRKCAGRGVGRLREGLARFVGEDDAMGEYGDGAGRGNGAWVLWCVVVGVLLAEGTSEEAWFVGLVVRMAKDAGVGGLQELEEVLERMVYDRVTLGVSLRRMWDRCLSVLIVS